jgi:hypothetical protein
MKGGANGLKMVLLKARPLYLSPVARRFSTKVEYEDDTGDLSKYCFRAKKGYEKGFRYVKKTPDWLPLNNHEFKSTEKALALDVDGVLNAEHKEWRSKSFRLFSNEHSRYFQVELSQELADKLWQISKGNIVWVTDWCFPFANPFGVPIHFDDPECKYLSKGHSQVRQIERALGWPKLPIPDDFPKIEREPNKYTHYKARGMQQLMHHHVKAPVCWIDDELDYILDTEKSSFAAIESGESDHWLAKSRSGCKLIQADYNQDMGITRQHVDEIAKWFAT